MVVVTGAGGAVGALLVERFLANGDTVIATDVSDDVLADHRLRSAADPRVLTIAADISVEADCLRLADLARERTGRGRCADQLRRVLPGPAIRGHDGRRMAPGHRHQPDRPPS